VGFGDLVDDDRPQLIVGPLVDDVDRVVGTREERFPVLNRVRLVVQGGVECLLVPAVVGVLALVDVPVTEWAVDPLERQLEFRAGVLARGVGAEPQTPRGGGDPGGQSARKQPPS
jgi:hypothetical protein